jgi:hypothetical protein
MHELYGFDTCFEDMVTRMEVKKKMHRECCCGHSYHERKHGHGFGHRRRFFTKAEKVEKLQNYAEELKKELIAVEEHIKKLQR